MRFESREHAGRLLAEELAPAADREIVVAAIPRGGVIVARQIADRLSAPLTLAYAHKLGAPTNPELAFGALDEDGCPIVDPFTVRALDIDDETIEQIRAREHEELQRRVACYHAPPLAGYLPRHSVVLVDDGLATGLTMRAALAYVRRHGAPRVTVATPCASGQAARYFQRRADQFACLIVDDGFLSVGGYYDEFPQVSDEEVLGCLAQRADLG